MRIILSKIKKFIKANEADLILAIAIILVALISFALGRLSVIWSQKEPIRVEYLNEGKTANLGNFSRLEGQNQPQNSDLETNTGQEKGLFVGSKNSNKYHFPWCSGAKRIKEENKIWFSSKQEAESRGYAPAGNCEGL